VLCGDAQGFLAARPPARPFDVVFLDPPFGSSALTACARRLDAGWLTPGARIYVEHARRDALPALPPAWQELRSGHAGEVGYHLFGAMPTGSETTA